MTPETLRDLVNNALEDLKARDVVTLPVADVTDITDYMIIASGTSNRHVKALVDNVVEEIKAAGTPPIGIEGRETNEWVLVDLGDVLLHVMQDETREFYDLERLWTEFLRHIGEAFERFGLAIAGPAQRQCVALDRRPGREAHAVKVDGHVRLV